MLVISGPQLPMLVLAQYTFSIIPSLSSSHRGVKASLDGEGSLWVTWRAGNSFRIPKEIHPSTRHVNRGQVRAPLLGAGGW